MIVLASEMVESNGKTVRENNSELSHILPLQTLVEIDCDYSDSHGLRLFVVGHTRDCDGTPLYSLSVNKNYATEFAEYEKECHDYPDGFRILLKGQFQGSVVNGFSESSLKVIKLPDLKT